jgi:EmrB/QacA subfamily drug resistance transporter
MDERSASFQGDPRKWLALAVLLLAQMMLILDTAIVNVAVPSAQADLQIAPADVQWVVTAYLLPFGGLLLLGGRVADYLGRKRVFCVAILGFAIASGMGGAADSQEVLFAARALQGLFAAAAAPALLSMLTLGFPRGPDRTRAFSLYGGVSAAGGAFGLVIGGLLTEYLSWRWSLLINLPLSAIVVAGAIPLLRESRAAGKPRYDVAGGLLATLGLLCMIYAIANAPEEGWGAASTLTILGAGVALLVAFLVWETKAAYPLLPLGILTDRTRGGGFLALATVYAPGSGMTLLMLIFIQGPLGEGALAAGLYFAPIPAAAIFGATLSSQLLPRVSPRLILGVGTLFTAVGLLSLTRVGVDATFAADLLPGFALFGLGSSVMFVAGNAIALSGVSDEDSGLASGVVNAVQQVGAALGVAILSAIAANAAASHLAENGPASAAQALAEGNDLAFLVGTAMVVAGGIAAALMMASDDPIIARASEPAAPEPAQPTHPAPAATATPALRGTAGAAVSQVQAAPPPPADPWVPMTARLAKRHPAANGSERAAARPWPRSAPARAETPTGNGSSAEAGTRSSEELVLLLLSAGRDVASGTLRAGEGAAGRAIVVSRRAGRRVIRRISA